jgi:hypothetical protein
MSNQAAATVFQLLWARQEEDFLEARANVQPETLTADVLLDDMPINLYDEPLTAEALERRKRHGVIGYS